MKQPRGTVLMVSRCAVEAQYCLLLTTQTPVLLTPCVVSLFSQAVCITSL